MAFSLLKDVFNIVDGLGIELASIIHPLKEGNMNGVTVMDIFAIKVR